MKKDTGWCRVNELCMNGVLVPYRIRVCFCACFTRGGSENIKYCLLLTVKYVLCDIVCFKLPHVRNILQCYLTLTWFCASVWFKRVSDLQISTKFGRFKSVLRDVWLAKVLWKWQDAVCCKFAFHSQECNLICAFRLSRVDDRGFKSRKGQEIFLFSKSQAHPASQSVCTGCSLSGGKAAGVWCWSLTSI